MFKLPVCLSMALCVVTLSFGQIPSDSLLVYYPFDSLGAPDTLYDLGPRHLNQKITGATWQQGKNGKALSFNGTSANYAASRQDTNAVPASVANSFSISLWVYPRGTEAITSEVNSGVGGTTAQKQMAIDCNQGGCVYNNCNGGHSIAGISVGTNGISVYECSDSYYASILIYSVSISGWTHIVVVYTNNTPKLYVNGTLVHSGLHSNYIVHPCMNFGGGSEAIAWGGWYNGMLDEVRVYKRSLTGAEVLALYQGGTSPIRVMLTSGSSWSAITDGGNITVECIGGGGGGGEYYPSASSTGGGGGAGEYRKSSVAYISGSSVSYSIGQGGTGGSNPYSIVSTNGGATSWNNGQVLANGGIRGGDGGNGYGGSGGTGQIGYNGGNGAQATGYTNDGGGGGAGGPNGAGVNGSYAAGAGLIFPPTPYPGGNGGAGDNGSGGAGGSGTYAGGPNANGGNGTEWTTVGSGGGGGGAGSGTWNAGGSGGNYGGGGGGNGYNPNPGGAGAPGVIIVTYTPPQVVPTTPTLISPSNNALGLTLNPTLLWNKTIGATSYRLQVSTVSTFATTVKDSSGITDTAIALSGLANNTQYYWRVNATNTNGTSAWASSYNFTTILTVPVLSSPANGAIGVAVSPTLSWNTVSGAATYRVQVSTTSTFASTVVDDSTVSAASRAVTGLATSTTYWWRANAKNAGGISVYSAAWSFTTVPPAPGAPTTISPVTGVANVPVSVPLVWHSLSGATAYHLLLSLVADFSTTIKDTAGLTDTSLALAGLSTGTRYYWCVCATNAGGPSAWSVTANFTTIVALPSIVSLVSPLDTATVQSDSVFLVWLKAAPAVTKYMLQVATDSAMSHLFVQDSLIADTTRLLTALSNNITYWWRVKANNAAGWGTYSQKIRFTVSKSAVLSNQFAVKSFSCNSSYKNLRYSLPQQCFVSVKYYDIKGRQVTSLVNRVQSPGNYSLVLPVSQWARGTYIQVFEAGGFVRKNLFVVM